MVEPGIVGGAVLPVLPRLDRGLGRRTSRRYQCPPAMLSQLVLPDGAVVSAWVLNLSTTGVGVAVLLPLESGLEVLLQCKVGEPPEVRTATAYVRHSTLDLDGLWRVGCDFVTPLTAEQLEEFL